MSIRLFDVVFSFLLIILLIPVKILLLLLCSICIEFPPLYITKRLGKEDKEFVYVKFKSMKNGRESGRVFFEQDRINAFGRFIRKFHLDEIPELYLILIGKMSFVGPRALPKKLLKNLDTDKRHSVLPGITCLAQIWLLRNGQLDKKLQIRLDNRYIGKRSFKYNIKIILATLNCLMKSKNINLDPNLNEQRRNYGNRLI